MPPISFLTVSIHFAQMLSLTPRGSRFQHDYVIKCHAWVKNTTYPPQSIVFGDGYQGSPSDPLVSFTGRWFPDNDNERLLLNAFVPHAKKTPVPDGNITYQELFQAVNGGLGRYNAQLMEAGQDGPSMRGQLSKAFPWSISPFNFP